MKTFAGDQRQAVAKDRREPFTELFHWFAGSVCREKIRNACRLLLTLVSVTAGTACSGTGAELGAESHVTGASVADVPQSVRGSKLDTTGRAEFDVEVGSRRGDDGSGGAQPRETRQLERNSGRRVEPGRGGADGARRCD